MNQPVTEAATSRTSRIDPGALMQLRSLELRARYVVEGFLAGLNRSPYHGFSVEFTEYRQYVPGDDLRHLDWRVLARSDREFIKRFEDETNLRCQLLVDFSKSMEFGSLGFSKLEYARTLAATLAYFLGLQRDAVGLARFSDTIDDYIPPRFRIGHLRRILVSLEKPAAGNTTSFAIPLSQLAERLLQRGLVIFISDLLAPLDRLESTLSMLAARGQETIVFQLLDPAEMHFRFDHPLLFEDLESGERLYVDPNATRASYQQKLGGHLEEVSRICNGLGLELHRVETDHPLEELLPHVLRMRLSGKSRRLIRKKS